MGALASLAGAIVNAILGALFAALRGRRQDEDRIATHERASVAEAADETQQAISEIADDRSKVSPASDDPDALARSLRARTTGSGGDGANRPGAGRADGAKG